MADIDVCLTKGELIMLAILVNDLYGFMVKAGISEFAIGHGEVKDLLDKLTLAIKKLADKEKEMI